MNEKTAYEQIITGKLQAIPVPDMADAIWARIEAQLDLDMPDQGSPPNDTPRFPTGGTIIGGISFLFVIVFVAFFIVRKKENNSPQPISTPSNTSTSVLKENQALPTAGSQTAHPTQKGLAPLGNTSATFQQDSSMAILPQVVTNADSTLNLPVAVSAPITTTPKLDSLPPAKKKRGVTGITDDDYGIVPKKDSSNNK